MNEELVSHSVCEEGTGTPTLDTPGPDGSLAIDTMDGAIISFGANGGVNGVPTPFGMVTDANYDPVVLQVSITSHYEYDVRLPTRLDCFSNKIYIIIRYHMEPN